MTEEARDNEIEKKTGATLIKHVRQSKPTPVSKKPVVKKKVVVRKVVKPIPAKEPEKKKVLTTKPSSPPEDVVEKTAPPNKPEERKMVKGVVPPPRRPKEASFSSNRDNGTAAKRRETPPRMRSASTPAPPHRPPVNLNDSSSQGDKRDNKHKQSSKKFYKQKKGSGANRRREERDKFIMNPKARQAPVPVANPVPKEIEIMETITVSELARKMNLKASDLISNLMKMGMLVTINQQIDHDTATLLADEYKCKVKVISLYEETLIESEETDESLEVPRPPIVTVMGHVDHGKTKLLDAIRETDIVEKEHGGITQHIGAYMVKTEKGEITFLDTPGHAAFTLMRARGAQVTDIVVLVVAADDGVKPQTIEAISHAKEAGVPIIIAVNKIDLPDANIDRVMQQLSEHGIMSESWGGHHQFVEVSALQKTGINDLLDTILLESELLTLKASLNCRAEGKVIESRIDQGRGIVSTVLVERGTLKIGDSFVAGIYHGRVRAMFDDLGNKIEAGTPSTPVEILGFSGTPGAGDPFQVTENEKMARQYGQKRQELKKHEESMAISKVTLDDLYDHMQEGEIQELKVIIKGDVHGSVEALQQALEKLSTPEIRLICIYAAAGAIVESDVNLASASNAIIVGFHVRPTPKATLAAEQEKVDIRKYNIIYDVVQDIRNAMEGMLAPDMKEENIGMVEVREIFKISRVGTIAGCMVTSGVVRRKSMAHLIRNSIVVHTGAFSSLKRFKDDAKEVKAGFECGLSLEGFDDIQVGDTLEIYEVKEVARKLSDTEKNQEPV